MERNNISFCFSSTNLFKDWTPIVGDETMVLLNRRSSKISTENLQTLLDETGLVLSQCKSPGSERGNEIGLVFGYVQSGKTMSFTTLTALAKDNGFQVVIIIAGISTNLVDQNFTRLEMDLRIDDRTDLQWLSLKNLRLSELTNVEQVKIALAEWLDPTFPKAERRCILITVMKQKNHLPNLTEVIRTLQMERVPVLIIDDEADQHSLNTRGSYNMKNGTSESSRIFQSISDLRDAIPCHSFIQYTATPQANLFINMMNKLSPNFVQLLSPGKGYCGGAVFFKESVNDLIKIITDIEDVEDVSEPPASLLEALRFFFVGVAIGTPTKDGGKRSMMIHSSRRTFSHEDYYRFVNSVKKRWEETLALSVDDKDRLELIDEFKATFDELSKTVGNLGAFEEIEVNLRHAIRRTIVQSLNSATGNTTIVNWRANYSFILIGGQAMDRGFTVEGLTVTYMPRSIGVGNADTIQQRARFFGYKKEYLGFCRVYLDSDARDAYVNYVTHEEDMRRQLQEHIFSGQTLNEWYRNVFLTSDLNLTRNSVLDRNISRIRIEDWTQIRHPHSSKTDIEKNRELYQQWILDLGLDSKIVDLCSVALSDALMLLSDLRFSNYLDSKKFECLIYILERVLEEFPNQRCNVVQFGSFKRNRERRLDSSGMIRQLFQGKNNKSEGDRSVVGSEICFQFHILRLVSDEHVEIAGGVIGFACFLPENIRNDFAQW